MTTKRRFKMNENSIVTPCQKCGNNTEFTGVAEQVCEDGCEVFVVCKCGYEPTQGTGHTYEDVWGGVDDDTLRVALSCWNSAIAEAEENRI